MAVNDDEGDDREVVVEVDIKGVACCTMDELRMGSAKVRQSLQPVY